MKTDSMPNAPADVVSFLARSDDDAASDLFLRLCRNSPFLRKWLWSEFARFEHVRAEFKRVLDATAGESDSIGADSLRQLACSQGDPIDNTKRTIRKQLHLDTGRIYGGLTWSDVERLVRSYHAGTLDAGAFLLAHDWRASSESAGVSPRLLNAAALLMEQVIRGKDRRLLRHVLKAADFLEEFSDTRGHRVALGHVNAWKVSVLLYLLNHPKPAYRTRELRAHLMAQGLDIETKDIRRFCSRHGIKRDMRAGRPRRQTPDHT